MFSRILWAAGWAVAVAGTPWTQAQAPASPSGFGCIKAACVIGEVTAVNQDNQEVVPLHNNDELFQNYAIKTAANASIVLVFSNGATVRLGANTEMVIREFLQDPFAEGEAPEAGSKSEPVRSSTKLRLVSGELVGHVAKLQHDSTYQVELPCGVAGIRGTTFRHAYYVGPKGGAQVSMATSEGEVMFAGPDGKEVPVPADVEVSARVRARGGFAKLDSHPIPLRITTIIDHHTKVMAVHAKKVTFRRADVAPRAGRKPVIRRDPAAKRETNDDTKDIEREVQEREKAPPKPKPAPTPAAKTPAPPAKKK